MAPIFGSPNYDFTHTSSEEEYLDQKLEGVQPSLTEMTFWYMIVLIAMLLIWLCLFFCLRIIALNSNSSGVIVELKDSAPFPDILWSVLSTSTTFLIIVFIITCIRVIVAGQKTRNPQQRRLYVGSRARPSLSQQEPTIFVSPSNLPPPPKYECMAPPSYEEVVGVHYPNYQIPITQPITTALAHSSNDNPQTRNDSAPETVITVSNETRRNSVPVVRS